MKIFYLKDHKWLLPQNQRVRNGLFGYRQYWAPVEHIKPLKKNKQNLNETGTIFSKKIN